MQKFAEVHVVEIKVAVVVEIKVAVWQNKGDLECLLLGNPQLVRFSYGGDYAPLVDVGLQKHQKNSSPSWMIRILLANLI